MCAISTQLFYVVNNYLYSKLEFNGFKEKILHPTK